jgi:uncharacterized SAM-binding protein YcdF (DUF218 family)
VRILNSSPLSFFILIEISTELLLVGLILLWFTKKQKAGKCLVTIGLLFLLAFSTYPFATVILSPLEKHYPATGVLEQKDLKKLSAKYIVVLGGSQVSDPAITTASQFQPSSLVRLVEGILLYRQIPGSKLIFSGGNDKYEPTTNAELMKKMALSLGVKKEDILLEDRSKNTYEEAKIIKDMVGKEKFILVTSASHMLRSMALFKKFGMQPIPAPTNHLAKKYHKIPPDEFFPKADNLKKSEVAFHEYLALIKEKLAGRI